MLIWLSGLGAKRRGRGACQYRTKLSKVDSVLVHRKVSRWQRMRQSVITACRLLCGDVYRAVFITLTYREGVEWEPGHIRDFRNALHHWCKRRGVKLKSVWVLETTLRGRPHYHALIFLPRALSLPKPDNRGWWPHGMSKIETARNPVGYMAGYMGKGGQTAFTAPKGARICGASGLSAEERDEKSWWMKPRWVREVFGITDRPAKVQGGYLARATGEFLRSPWKLVLRGPKWEWCEFARVDWFGLPGWGASTIPSAASFDCVGRLIP